MTIRVIYTSDPGFPAADQHPDAVRYLVGPYFVDSTHEPTLEEVEAILRPSPSIENAKISAQRSKEEKVEQLERRMSLGAPQEEVNKELLDLLKELVNDDAKDHL